MPRSIGIRRSWGLLRTACVVLSLSLAGLTLPTVAPARAASNHVISGRVTFDLPIPGVYIQLYEVDSSGGLTQVAATGASQGSIYSFSVPDGSYKVYFDPYYDSSTEPEWYQDAPSPETSATISVAGADVYLDQVDLERWRAITGRVVGPDGVGLVGVEVAAYPPDDDDNAELTRVSGAGGFFSIGVGRGSWKLRFRDSMQRVATHWSGGSTSFDSASVVSIQHDTDIGDIPTERGGSISGTVTTGLGQPLRKLWVALYDSSDLYVDDAKVTGRRGGYTFPALNAGDYRVEFNAGRYSWSFVPEFYDDQASLATATAVTVAQGQDVIGVDATLTAQASTPPSAVDVTGRVLDESGVPVEGILVSATDQALDPTDQAGLFGSRTDATGRFYLTGIPPGLQFSVFYWDGPTGLEEAGEFAMSPVYYPGTPTFATAVTFVATGSTIDVGDLTVHENGGISGHVLLEDGTPLNEYLPTHRGRPLVRAYDDAGSIIDTTKVQPDGSYELPVLRQGTYRIQLVEPGDWSPRYTEVWSGGGATFAEATPILVQSGQVTGGVDATVVAVYRSLSGTVTDGAGQPLGGVSVCPYTPSETNCDYALRAVQTGPDGTFLLRLAPGDYRIGFGDYESAIVPEYYPDQSTLSSATPVTVSEGQPPASLGVVTVARVPRLSGTVTDERSQPIYGASVTIINSDGSQGPGTQTDVDGTWRSPGLAPGTYRVRFATGYGYQYYDRASSLSSATPVSVQMGQWRSGIDGHMTPGVPSPPEPPPPFQNRTAPRMMGVPRVGHRVSADPGTWGGGQSPGPYTYTYEWHVDSDRIDRVVSTAPIYVPTRAWAGMELVVQVTAYSGNDQASTQSAIAKIGPTRSRTRLAARVLKATRHGSRVRLKAEVTGRDGPVLGLVRLRVGHRVIALVGLRGGKLKRFVTLPRGTYALRAQYLGSNAWSRSRGKRTITVR